MKVVIHQPQYLPYAGFFHKLSLADAFVIMDDAQYDKRYTNRNRIITPSGWAWLTIPINKEHKFLPNYNIEINNKLPWRQDHWKKIYHSYAGTKFFHMYKDYFEELYKKDWKMLLDIDMQTTIQIIKWLGIKIDIIRESELKIKGESTQRLVNVCKAVGADTYISGSGGKDYLEEPLFEKNNIRLGYQKYKHTPYSQHLAKSFIPDLSIIDLLANVGPQSSNLILNDGKMQPITA